MKAISYLYPPSRFNLLQTEINFWLTRLGFGCGVNFLMLYESVLSYYQHMTDCLRSHWAHTLCKKKKVISEK